MRETSRHFTREGKRPLWQCQHRGQPGVLVLAWTSGFACSELQWLFTAEPVSRPEVGCPWLRDMAIDRSH